jgi:hypothetical protein
LIPELMIWVQRLEARRGHETCDQLSPRMHTVFCEHVVILMALRQCAAARSEFFDLIQAMIFQMSSSVLTISP